MQARCEEYSAVLAMNPLDKASANYDVAKAYLAAGDKGKAEEQRAVCAGGGSGIQAGAEAVIGD